MPTAIKLRLRLPNGAEFEAEGDPDAVRNERAAFAAFLRRQETSAWEETPTDAPSDAAAHAPSDVVAHAPSDAARTPSRHAAKAAIIPGPERTQEPMDDRTPSRTPSPAWDSIIESKGAHIQLRAKLQSDKIGRDACAVLLAAAQKMLGLNKPTSAQLSLWLRASGYPIKRLDRIIEDSLDRGEILASGSRRARRYELTGPGQAKAHHLANELAALIT